MPDEIKLSQSVKESYTVNGTFDQTTFDKYRAVFEAFSEVNNMPEVVENFNKFSKTAAEALITAATHKDAMGQSDLIKVPVLIDPDISDRVAYQLAEIALNSPNSTKEDFSILCETGNFDYIDFVHNAVQKYDVTSIHTMQVQDFNDLSQAINDGLSEWPSNPGPLFVNTVMDAVKRGNISSIDFLINGSTDPHTLAQLNELASYCSTLSEAEMSELFGADFTIKEAIQDVFDLRHPTKIEFVSEYLMKGVTMKELEPLRNDPRRFADRDHYFKLAEKCAADAGKDEPTRMGNNDHVK